jgi:hypothetical protein
MRPGGTRLFFAKATWRDRSGAQVPGPPLLVSATMASNAEEDAGAVLVDAASQEHEGGGDP